MVKEVILIWKLFKFYYRICIAQTLLYHISMPLSYFTLGGVHNMYLIAHRDLWAPTFFSLVLLIGFCLKQALYLPNCERAGEQCYHSSVHSVLCYTAWGMPTECNLNCPPTISAISTVLYSMKRCWPKTPYTFQRSLHPAGGRETKSKSTWWQKSAQKVIIEDRIAPLHC